MRKKIRTRIKVGLRINKLSEFVLIPIIKFNSGSARKYHCAFMMYKKLRAFEDFLYNKSY